MELSVQIGGIANSGLLFDDLILGLVHRVGDCSIEDDAWLERMETEINLRGQRAGTRRLSRSLWFANISHALLEAAHECLPCPAQTTLRLPAEDHESPP